MIVTKEIKSLQHPFVKHLVKLRRERAYRLEQKKVLVAGKTLIEELAPLPTLIAAKGAPIRVEAKECWFVTPEILKKVTGLPAPEPYAALVDLPAPGLLEGCSYLLACDQIADPGNLGTLLRTALAFGWQGVFLTEGTSDPFNDKAIRSAKGASFRLPMRSGSWAELKALIAHSQLEVVIADIRGEPFVHCSPSVPTLLLLGNETRGARAEALKSYRQVCIPLSEKMESLNVAAAGAILMHALGPL